MYFSFCCPCLRRLVQKNTTNTNVKKLTIFVFFQKVPGPCFCPHCWAGEGIWKMVSLVLQPWRQFQEFLTCLVDAVRLANVCPSLIVWLPFKPLFFAVFQGGRVCSWAPQWYHLSVTLLVTESEVGFLSLPCLCLSYSSICGLSFVVQMLFNQPSVLLEKELLYMSV